MQIDTLYQDLVVEDGEKMLDVARSLIGSKGKAILISVVHYPGEQWPTATYRGTRHELAAIEAKANGRQIGRPKS